MKGISTFRQKDIPEGTNLVFDQARSGPLHAPEDIAPGGTIQTLVERATIPIHPVIAPLFSNGKLIFVFAGGAIYEDVFSKAEHVTEFCFYLDLPSAATGPFKGCSTHNRIE